MIKYLGSKRKLVPRIVALAQAIPGARTALDLFTGTTRVAQGLKAAGFEVTTNDTASYSEVLGRAYIATDARTVNTARVQTMIDALNALPGERGYFTETFCEASRYVQPHNGMRVDAIRARLDSVTDEATERAILLTSLLEAADRVDSTTGLQMAYLKQWSLRSHRALRLRMPLLLDGPGVALRSDARDAVRRDVDYDIAYIDPPYNQHSYYRNYHVWETLVRGDAPATYGIANKREDCRTTKSVFNSRVDAVPSLEEVFGNLRARHAIVSFSDEGFIRLATIRGMLAEHFGEVGALPVVSRRYVGAKIGIYAPSGELVGAPGHLTNTEWIFVAGPDAAQIVARVEAQDLAEVA